MKKIFSTGKLLAFFSSLLTLVLCSTACFGQGNPQAARSRWSYGLRFSGGLSGRTLKGNSSTVNLRNAMEKGKPGFEIGAQMNYRLSER
ncbi:hypothetical protein, partial [Pedobacter sp. UBA5917]|uniref:hypothetical protein n=1 Tax=Pedobacter sp. UBA5917 TaxID=1947061 RepID=UPI0025EC5DD3